jgi:type IV fimbrial biogenesis protein FimT
MRNARGVTLIELLTVIAIAAILAMVAVPSFSRLVASQRLKSAASNLQATLLVARSEGIKRNGSVCVSTSSNSCTAAGSWSQGWYVTDPAANVVIGTYPAFPSLTITGPASAVTYQSSGRVSATPSAPFKVSSPNISDIRCVNITVTGLPSVTTSGC